MPNIGEHVLQVRHGRIEWVGTEEVLWRYQSGNGLRPMDIAPPILEIDNGLTILTGADGCFQRNNDPLVEGVSEWIITSTVRNQSDLVLRVVFRVSEDTPVIRFRYELQASTSRRMTGGSPVQGERYASISADAFRDVQEIRLSDFNEVLHCYRPVEQNIPENWFSAGYRAGGPMLVMSDGLETRLIAYEHGSPATDPFLGYDLSADRGISLRPVKGNWPTGKMLSEEDPFNTPWFDIMAISGDLEVAASTWRTFVLRSLTPCQESRKPYVFYNTWANQERSKWWRGKPYLEPMNEARMLEEIDIAHRMGIEVFVLDTGWYEKTGDWEASPERFPWGLTPIRERLDGYGMKLGLWFNPLMAAQSSRMLAAHADCIRSWKGVPSQPQAVWETEESLALCLVSRYREAFADRLIRLALEEGVRYFKWDAIDLYGCDAPGHFHGDESNTEQERADCHAFELVRSMAYVVERLQAACPDVIVDFDVTEGGRAVGLGFLSVGKYFLVNNGPYFHNYDVPIDLKTENWNLFFQPGQARNRMLRMCLSLDTWLPSVLFLGHVLPEIGRAHV